MVLTCFSACKDIHERGLSSSAYSHEASKDTCQSKIIQIQPDNLLRLRVMTVSTEGHILIFRYHCISRI